jgi:hypothetical protein
MLRRVGWFLALWAGGCLIVAVLAYGIRFFLV